MKLLRTKLFTASCYFYLCSQCS